MEEAVRCARCGESKARSEFYRARSRKNGLQIRCKVCQKQLAAEWFAKNGKEHYQKNKKRQLEWRENNPDRYAARQRRYHIRKKYGLAEVEYNKLILSQQGKCAICQQDGVELDVDHCHTRGNVRALLCNPCNRGLAAFRDKPGVLRAAAAYLEKHNE